MDVAARLRSDGRVTIPREVRDALAIEEGDEVVFRVEGGRVTMSRNRDFIELAGAVDVPPEKRGTPWAEILRETHQTRAERRLRGDHSFWHPADPDELVRASGVKPYVYKRNAKGAEESEVEEFLDSIFGNRRREQHSD